MSHLSTSPNIISGDVSILGGNLTLDNSKSLQSKDSGGTPRYMLGMSAADAIALTNLVGSITVSTFPVGSDITIDAELSGGTKAIMDNTGLRFGAEARRLSSVQQWARHWIGVNISSAEIDSFSMGSITDNGAGDTTIALGETKAAVDYVPVTSVVETGGTRRFLIIKGMTTSSITINCMDSAGTLTDTQFHLAIFDDA